MSVIGYVKYHMHSCSGHDTVIVNIGQSFKIAVSNSESLLGHS